MKIFDQLVKKYGSYIALICVISVLYATTLAPDITWANGGYDGGDLAAAAATGGVAHPSGYPTYLVLASLFQRLPLGSLAFRTNLMSAVWALLAALLAAILIQRNAVGRVGIRRLAGFLAGLGFGFSPLLWSQAVITEVYTLHAVFIALILWVICESFRYTSPWLDRVGGVVFGLALGNQITFLLMLPAWLLSGILHHRTEIESNEGVRGWFSRLGLGSLARRLGWLILGFSIYLTLPLRAESGSPINWGNPVDLDGFWWLVSGQLYQERVLVLTPALAFSRIVFWAKLLVSQYGLLGLVTSLVGMVFKEIRSRRFNRVLVYTFLAYTVFAIGYNTPDSYVLLIPSFLVLGLWFGLGVAGLLEYIDGMRWRNWGLPLSTGLFFLAVLINVWVHYPQVDASRDQRAVNFGLKVLSVLPENAIVVPREDEDTFTLWYYHYALGKRPDISVINSGLLAYPWYRDRLMDNYPGLALEDHYDCYQCMLEDLAAFNSRPVCESFWDSPDHLVCKP